MRAVICRELGERAVLAVEEVPAPSLAAGGVRIAVRAAGVNFADSLMMAGTYQDKHVPPYIPGMEAAGVVLEVAPGVTTCRAGDRVMACLDIGAFAEEVVARAEDVFVIPDTMDFDIAAAFPIAYGTSHMGLERTGLRAGEVLVVHGAAGGVGLTAVEIGRRLGAIVIATAGGPDKLAVAKAHGAHHGIDYSCEDIRERVRAITAGRGADVVYDPVGGDVFDASLRCLAKGGRIEVVGFAAGRVPQIPANLLLVKNITVIGFYWGAYRRLDPGAVRASMQEALQWWSEGGLDPHVSHRLPLERAGEAVMMLKTRGATGKVVVLTGR